MRRQGRERACRFCHESTGVITMRELGALIENQDFNAYPVVGRVSAFRRRTFGEILAEGLPGTSSFLIWVNALRLYS